MCIHFKTICSNYAKKTRFFSSTFKRLKMSFKKCMNHLTALRTVLFPHPPAEPAATAPVGLQPPGQLPSPAAAEELPGVAGQAESSTAPDQGAW